MPIRPAPSPVSPAREPDAARVRNLLLALIGAALLAASAELFVPTLGSGDGYEFCVVNRAMFESGNWVDLTYFGRDWLDKPHLPFWAVALSYHLFGVNAAAVTAPGLAFFLLGAYFTFRLGRDLFGELAGLLAALVTLTPVSLLVSLPDVRAESYLLGTITPACYCWWKYDTTSRRKYLAAGCLFGGLALMTKGPFVLVPIFSGVVCLSLYRKQHFRLLQPRWLIAIAGTVLVSLPELVCLYMQFDLHPEKTVFGTQGVSGLRWFFWDSQFGRFFNTGPIRNEGGDPFYFVHTFLWVFLPWTAPWLFSLFPSVSRFRRVPAAARERFVFLHGSFWPTFLLFSATRFQLQYYVNILVPFAALLTAGGFATLGLLPEGGQDEEPRGRPLDRTWPLVLLERFQSGTSAILLAAAIALPVAVFRGSWLSLAALPPAALALFLATRPGKQRPLQRLVVVPCVSALVLCLAVALAMSVSYPTRKIGWVVARVKGLQPSVPFYGTNRQVLEEIRFHLGNPVILSDRPPDRFPSYTLIADGDFRSLGEHRYRIVEGFEVLTGGFWFQGLFFRDRLESSLSRFDLVEVTGRKDP